MLDPPTTFEPYGKEFTLTPAVLQVIYIDFRNIQSLGISTVDSLSTDRGEGDNSTIVARQSHRSVAHH